MCTGFEIATIALGAASAVQGAQGMKEQKKANSAAAANSDKAFKQQEREINRANAKTPNIGAILEQNRNETKGSSTNLTGPGGVPTSQLTLGRNTLLGQ